VACSNKIMRREEQVGQEAAAGKTKERRGVKGFICAKKEQQEEQDRIRNK